MMHISTTPPLSPLSTSPPKDVPTSPELTELYATTVDDSLQAGEKKLEKALEYYKNKDLLHSLQECQEAIKDFSRGQQHADKISNIKRSEEFQEFIDQVSNFINKNLSSNTNTNTNTNNNAFLGVDCIRKSPSLTPIIRASNSSLARINLDSGAKSLCQAIEWMNQEKYMLARNCCSTAKNFFNLSMFHSEASALDNTEKTNHNKLIIEYISDTEALQSMSLKKIAEQHLLQAQALLEEADNIESFALEREISSLPEVAKKIELQAKRYSSESKKFHTESIEASQTQQLISKSQTVSDFDTIVTRVLGKINQQEQISPLCLTQENSQRNSSLFLESNNTTHLVEKVSEKLNALSVSNALKGEQANFQNPNDLI
jgi:hypothetical protein